MEPYRNTLSLSGSLLAIIVVVALWLAAQKLQRHMLVNLKHDFQHNRGGTDSYVFSQKETPQFHFFVFKTIACPAIITTLLVSWDEQSQLKRRLPPAELQR